MHIQADIIAGARSRTTLPLQLFAKKNARPGQYRLELSLPADPREVQSRPQNAPLAGGAQRNLPVPLSTASVTVRAMEPKITSVTPARPAYNTRVTPEIIVSDVPGSDILSITRSEAASDGYCGYRPDPRSVSRPGHRGGVSSSQWNAPHTLRVHLLPGEFDAMSSCRIGLSIRTKNVLGEEFLSFPPPFVLSLSAPPPPTRLPVSSTWTLKDYLELKPGFSKGVCSGSSLGAHGSIPVGIVNANGNLGFRARSGPIGTECDWRIATNRLEPGWTLHMKFRIRRVGDKCHANDGSTGRFDFSRLASSTIRKDGEVSLSSNLSANGNALWLVDLQCDATLSNDHEVLVEMVSASVSRIDPSGTCDWKCAFR